MRELSAFAERGFSRRDGEEIMRLDLRTVFPGVSRRTEVSMSAETMQWYRSKVDWWIALLLCVPPVASIAVCLALAFGGKGSEVPWGIASVLLVFGIYIGLVFPMRYGL